MPTLTGAQATIAQLVAEGVDVMLSIPGEHNIYLCDAINDHPHVRFITGRHEQDITFMANGYARASGKIAVPLVVTGPGVGNAITPLADAYRDSVPMVLIAAQGNRQWLGKGAFHEIKDQTALLGAVTKWNARAERVEDIPDLLQTAFTEAHGGRPGPTAVEIPMDVQTAKGDVTIAPAARRNARPQANAADVQEAARRLAAAQAPIVYIGSGAAIADCGPELRQLIERLQAPVLSTSLAKGVVPDDHPLSIGWGGVMWGPSKHFLEQADLGLVVGSSLDQADTNRWTLPLPKTLIQIDISPQHIGQVYQVSVPLIGDAQAVLRQLLDALAAQPSAERPSPAPRIADMKAEAMGRLEHTTPLRYVKAMQAALPRDAFVTNDAATVNGWTLFFLDRFLPRTYNITRNLAALGYAFPAALGAKLAYPDRQAVAVMGDGGFLFTSSALATAMQDRIPAVAVVFNDRGYTSIKRYQNQHFGRTIGTDLANPDFVALARAFGAAGARAESPAALHDALRAAFARDLPTIIDVPLDAQTAYL